MFSLFKDKLASLITPFYKGLDSSSMDIKQRGISPRRNQSVSKISDKIVLNLETAEKNIDIAKDEEDNRRKLKEGEKCLCLEGSIDNIKGDEKCENEGQKENELEQNKTVLKVKKGRNAKSIGTIMQSQIENIETQKPNPEKEDSFLYDWIKEKQPDFYLIKVHQNSKKKARIEEIKKKRQEEFEKSKDIEIKDKLLKKCIICSEEALIKESVQLACAHRIHNLCKEIVKWKPKMKCSLCERQSIREIPLHFNPCENSRTTGFSIQKAHFL